MKKMLILVCVLYALTMAAGLTVSAQDSGAPTAVSAQER